MNLSTLLSADRVDALLGLLAATADLPGDLVECGVYRGGMLAAMARACPGKRCWGFDTFTGLPAPRGIDRHRLGDFGDTTLAAVSAAMPGNVILRPGYFPDSARRSATAVCFAHVDFDLERSTADAIAWLRQRMTSGGIVVFDDWQWENCPGVAAAITAAGLSVVGSAPYQCYWRAP